MGFGALLVAQAWRPGVEIPIVVDRDLPWVLFRGFYLIERHNGPGGFVFTHPISACLDWTAVWPGPSR